MNHQGSSQTLYDDDDLKRRSSPTSQKIPSETTSSSGISGKFSFAYSQSKQRTAFDLSKVYASSAERDTHHRSKKVDEDALLNDIQNEMLSSIMVDAKANLKKNALHSKKAFDIDNENSIKKDTGVKRKSRLKRENKLFPCASCGKCYKKFSDLNDHALVHITDVADGTVLDDSVTDVLQQGEVGEKETVITPKRKRVKRCKCSICGKCFRDSCDLRRHVITHTNGKRRGRKKSAKPHKEERKKKTNTGRENALKGKALKSSLKKVEKGKEKQDTTRNDSTGEDDSVDVGSMSGSEETKTKHECEYCSRGFSYNSSLKRHIKFTHGVDLKRPSCNICQKQFTDSWKLKRHEFIHTGLKPYTCDVCNKQFSMNYNLLRHKVIHKASNSKK